jgi:hypothetical protein
MSPIVLEQIGTPDGVLLPGGLESIIRVLEPERDDLAFSVFAFDGVLKETTRESYEEVTSRVSGSEQGLQMSWDELVRLAEDTDDIWDFLLVGYSTQRHPPVRGVFEELASANEVVVEVFDSGSLRIALKSRALAQRASAEFPGLQPVLKKSPE